MGLPVVSHRFLILFWVLGITGCECCSSRNHRPDGHKLVDDSRIWGAQVGKCGAHAVRTHNGCRVVVGWEEESGGHADVDSDLSLSCGDEVFVYESLFVCTCPDAGVPLSC